LAAQPAALVMAVKRISSRVMCSPRDFSLRPSAPFDRFDFAQDKFAQGKPFGFAQDRRSGHDVGSKKPPPAQASGGSCPRRDTTSRLKARSHYRPFG